MDLRETFWHIFQCAKHEYNFGVKLLNSLNMEEKLLISHDPTVQNRFGVGVLCLNVLSEHLAHFVYGLHPRYSYSVYLFPCFFTHVNNSNG